MAEPHQSRRTFLRAAIAGVIGPFVGQSPGQDNSEDLVIREKHRDYTNPLTRSEIQDIQSGAIREHRHRTDSTKPVGKRSINLNDSRIVSFVYMIDQDSRSRSYIGRARDVVASDSEITADEPDAQMETPSAEKELRRAWPQSSVGETSTEAEETPTPTPEEGTPTEIVEPPPPPEEPPAEREPSFEAIESIQFAASSRADLARQTNSVLENSPQLDEPEVKRELAASWVTGATTEATLEPYGKVTSSMDLYRFGEGTNRVLYGTRHNIGVFPGIREFTNNNWRSRRATVGHHWERNDFDANPILIGHQPHGYEEGEDDVRAYLDAGGDSLEWEYNQPSGITRSNESSSETARWTWEWTSDNARETSDRFKLGSLVEASKAASGGDTILTSRLQVTFRKRKSPPGEESTSESQTIALG